MEENQARLIELMRRYETGTASAGEIAELDAWFEAFDQDEKLSAIKTPEQRNAIRDRMLLAINAELNTQILDNDAEPVRRKLWGWSKVAVAASILAVLSAGFYFLYYSKEPVAELAVVEESSYLPGSNKAVLTLSGGKKITLDDAVKGNIAKEGNTSIQKNGVGELIYQGAATDEELMYNTMTTPRGGQFHLILADGTGVWLNAQSSITYPVRFSGDVREVKTTGEVYFQVARQVAKPFLVKSAAQTVRVLGTHFNVNAYENEDGIRTTLIEGSVSVNADGKKQLLRPGQQSLLADGDIEVAEVDVSEVMAWQRGYFDFASADIREVMRQISRWYDLDVSFSGPVSKETFSGKIPRSWDLGQVLKIIRASQGVKITVQGRRIMVEG